MSDNKIRITLGYNYETYGDPIIAIDKGDVDTYVDLEGVYLAGYDENIFTPTEDIDDLIACLRKAKRILANPPEHLLAERIAPPRKLGPPCHCLAEMRWDTADGGHWRHVDDTITDHEAAPLAPTPKPPQLPRGTVEADGDAFRRMFQEAKAKGLPIEVMAGGGWKKIVDVELPQHKNPCVCTIDSSTGEIVDPDCFRDGSSK